MTGATSVEQICNEALDRIGYPESIGSIYDGTKQARVALRAYGQTRDDLLRNDDWGFAERNVVMTLLKAAPAGGYVPPSSWSSAYPPLPWLFEYAYPADCLKVRAIKAPVPLVPVFDPAPVVFRILNDDAFSPAQKVIVCNIDTALLTYTAQVTDPTTWEASFTEALIAALARRMAPSLAPGAEKMETVDERAAVETAQMIQG